MIGRFLDLAFGSQTHTRLSYRRLLCWIVCTGFVPFGWISGENYTAICMVFIGSDAAARVVSAYRRGPAP